MSVPTAQQQYKQSSMYTLRKSHLDDSGLKGRLQYGNIIIAVVFF